MAQVYWHHVDQEEKFMAEFFDLCPDRNELGKDAASHSGKDLTNDSLMISIPMETPEGFTE